MEQSIHDRSEVNCTSMSLPMLTGASWCHKKKTKKESISKPKCYIGSKATEYTGEPTEKLEAGIEKLNGG
jgi:hypothetical protein